MVLHHLLGDTPVITIRALMWLCSLVFDTDVGCQFFLVCYSRAAEFASVLIEVIGVIVQSSFPKYVLAQEVLGVCGKFAAFNRACLILLSTSMDIPHVVH